MSFSAVSIVGAGALGCEIALACAAVGIPVSLVPLHRGALPEVRRRLERRLALGVALGSLAPAAREALAGRIALAPDLALAAEADLVIDATACDPKARRAMVATLESRLTPGAVLATGGPGEHLPAVAEAVRRPDQLVGLRFTFAAGQPVRVDLTLLADTAPGVAAGCRGFVADLGSGSLVEHGAVARVGYREWLSSPGRDAAE